MFYSEPTDLAVIACPGGEAFADAVITHLKHMYKHRFTLKNDAISKRYDLSKEELIKDINLKNVLKHIFIRLWWRRWLLWRWPEVAVGGGGRRWKITYRT